MFFLHFFEHVQNMVDKSQKQIFVLTLDRFLMEHLSELFFLVLDIHALVQVDQYQKYYDMDHLQLNQLSDYF